MKTEEKSDRVGKRKKDLTVTIGGCIYSATDAQIPGRRVPVHILALSYQIWL